MRCYTSSWERVASRKGEIPQTSLQGSGGVVRVHGWHHEHTDAESDDGFFNPNRYGSERGAGDCPSFGLGDLYARKELKCLGGRFSFFSVNDGQQLCVGRRFQMAQRAP